MKRYIQKLCKAFLALLLTCQTLGVFSAVLAEQEVTAHSFQKNEAVQLLGQKKVIGYFANWQGDKIDIYPHHSDYGVDGTIDGKGFDPVNVNMEQLTHLNYAFIGIDGNGLPIFQNPSVDTSQGSGRDYIGQLAQLTKENDVSFMLSVGGRAVSLEGGFAAATATPERLNAFTNELINMMLEYGFDGIDLNWQFPENEEQQTHFVALVKQLREKLTETGAKTNRYYQLSAAVTGNYQKMEYVAPGEIHPYLDFFNVMTHDLTETWENETGHRSPMYAPVAAKDSKLTVSAALDEYVNVYQVPKHKLIMGMGYYSKGWFGVESAAVGASAIGAAIGLWDDQQNDRTGLNAWFHMKEKEQDAGNIVSWDEVAKVPYLYDPATQEFFTYENPQSIQYKVDYILENGYGGAMIWELSQDTTDYEIGTIVSNLIENWLEPDREGASSEGLEYSFIYGHYCERDPWDQNIVIVCDDTIEAAINGFSGSHHNLLIPASVMHNGNYILVRSITRDAIANKGLTSVVFERTVPSLAAGAFSGNPLQYIFIPQQTSTSGRDFIVKRLTLGMLGVTSQTILIEGSTPIYQWNGNNSWISIN